MKFDKVICLFEQSGTFKNEFKKLGYDAIDVDFENNFGETDVVVDIFDEIELSLHAEQRSFFGATADSLVLAFFPCTYFCQNNEMLLNGSALPSKTDLEKVEYSMERMRLTALNYRVLCQLFMLAYYRDFKLIVENPYTQPHFLTKFFPVKPTVIDKNRTEMGDCFVKPTQYFFVNCEPVYNLELLDYYVKKGRIRKVPKTQKFERSRISPVYAANFIRRYILDEDKV